MKIHVMAAALALAVPAIAPAQVAEGDTAPAFPIADSVSTGIKDWKALKGKVLLLDFFTTW